MAASRREITHLLLLLGLQAVVEVAQRGDQLGALGLDRARLGIDEGLGLGAIEGVAGHQRLDLGARVAATDERLALRAQLVGHRAELGLLCIVEVEAAADALDDALLVLGGVFVAHALPAVAVMAVRTGGQATEQDGGAEHADQGALEPGFHVEPSVASRPVLNMARIVRNAARDVLSAPYRRVSFFVARSVQRSESRAIADTSARPISDDAPVTSHVNCHPPATEATHATSGGPTNWPNADHCCIQPTVVDSVSSLGVTRTASANSVAGTSPPMAENTSTAR